MADLKEFEDALVKRLSKGNIDKTFLKTVSSTIVNLKKQGMVIDQVFDKGTPRIDRVLINGFVDPDVRMKLTDMHIFKKIQLFPYGILNPEGLRFKAELRF